MSADARTDIDARVHVLVHRERSSTCSRSSGYAVGAILKNLDLLDSYQAARHHRVKDRQEAIDFFPPVDDFDDHRQILRQAENLGRMNMARLTKSDMPPQDRRTGE